MAPANLSLASDALAFAVGGLTTYFDCYQTMTTRVGRVPETFMANRFVSALALLCGAIAAAACWISAAYPDSALSTVLTLKSSDPVRGFVVGASVLILIRSKLFNIENSPFGGDYLYDLARNSAIDDVNRKWTIFRSTFQNANIGAALLNAQFEPQVLALITSTLQARPATVQTSFNAKVTAVTGNRPAAGAADTVVTTYYRTLIGLSLDACGPTVVRTLSGFV